MTVEEKRDKIRMYCGSINCRECKLRIGGWDEPCNEHNPNTCPNIGYATERDLDRALGIIDTISTEPTKPTEDLVNHPNHYTNGGMECIDEMILIFGKEATMYFCLLNAWKYRRRALDKNGQQDMDKSHWYINKYKELKGELA